MGQKVAYVTFAIFIDVVIGGLILSGAWVLNKTFYAPLLIISFRGVRMIIEKRYSVLHFKSIMTCVLVSTAICIVSILLSFDYATSIISYIVMGAVSGYLTWLINDHIEKYFISKIYDIPTQLSRICKSERDYIICHMHIVEKRKTREIYDWVWDSGYELEYDSIRQIYTRAKKKLVNYAKSKKPLN